MKPSNSSPADSHVPERRATPIYVAMLRQGAAELLEWADTKGGLSQKLASSLDEILEAQGKARPPEGQPVEEYLRACCAQFGFSLVTARGFAVAGDLSAPTHFAFVTNPAGDHVAVGADSIKAIDAVLREAVIESRGLAAPDGPHGIDLGQAGNVPNTFDIIEDIPGFSVSIWENPRLEDALAEFIEDQDEFAL